MGTKQSDYNEKDDRHENHIHDHHLDKDQPQVEQTSSHLEAAPPLVQDSPQSRT